MLMLTKEYSKCMSGVIITATYRPFSYLYLTERYNLCLSITKAYSMSVFLKLC